MKVFIDGEKQKPKWKNGISGGIRCSHCNVLCASTEDKSIHERFCDLRTKKHRNQYAKEIPSDN